jgi:hypothetical protein
MANPAGTLTLYIWYYPRSAAPPEITSGDACSASGMEARRVKARRGRDFSEADSPDLEGETPV